VESRRTALIRIATAATSVAVKPLLAEKGGTEHHLHEMGDQSPTPLAVGPEYLSKAEYSTVSKLVDLIIPRTDTPGALDAGVPHWIDRRMAGAKPEVQDQFKRGLSYLDEQAHTVSGSSFAELTEQQQTAILKALSADSDTAKSGFFKMAKDLTIDGYYKSEAGLVQELGFKGNTFRSSFPGCIHPEHQATEEHSQ
jgi:hypothetical protein